MVDVTYIKSTSGLMMLLNIISSAVAMGCWASNGWHKYVDWAAYLLAAVCIVFILSVIFYVLIILGKHGDDRLVLGMLFLCSTLMIVADILIAVKSDFFSAMHVAYVSMIVLTVLLIVQILAKLGFVKV